MITRLSAGAKRILGLHYPGRSLVIEPEDVFLVSYPKSGNTWSRFLIANLINPQNTATFANIHELVPDPDGTTKRHLQQMSRPRIIKSHSCFEPRFPRVIYIVRDPRDVFISQYHYQRKRERIINDFPLHSFLERFLAGQTCQHGSWGENVGTWMLARREHDNFLLLRYEDMLTDTVGELSRIAAFLKLRTSADQVRRAVELSSVEQMRRSELTESQRSSLTKGGRQDILFVRAAKSGDWRSSVPEDLAARIVEAWGPLMLSLGYETDCHREKERLAASEMNSTFRNRIVR
jgi:hypothetical protein